MDTRHTFHLAGLGAGLTLLAGLAACGPDPAATPTTDLQVTVLDEPAFETLVDNADGGLLVVNLFTTWCSACRGELPAFERTARDATDVTFAVVSLDEAGTTDEVRAFAAGLGLTLPVYHLAVPDPITAVQRHLEPFRGAIPLTVVIGEDGRILADHPGRASRAELEALVEEARTARDVAAARAPRAPAG